MDNQISIVIPTKEHSKELTETINSINKQTYKPKEIILVSFKKINKKFLLNKKIKIKILFSEIQNQVIQRNIGINNLSNKSDIILQLDDRIVLNKNCLFELNKFWRNTDSSTIGVGINQIKMTKENGLINTLFFNLNKFRGRVFKNGIVVDYSNLKKDIEVMWLKGGLSSWKIKKNKKLFNRKYPIWKWSVFEDVEYSLNKKKKEKLFVSSKAKASIIERKKPLNFKNLFYRGATHTYAQKKIVKKFFKNLSYFLFSIPLIILLSTIFSLLTINIHKFIYNLGRIRGLFIINFK